MAFTIPWQLMGTTVQGDFADLTIYTDRFNRKIAYRKEHSTKPRSAAQQLQSLRFKLAQSAWKALSPGEKRNLELATLRLSMCLTGQNLFISAAMRNMTTAYATVARQANLPLPALPAIP